MKNFALTPRLAKYLTPQKAHGYSMIVNSQDVEFIVLGSFDQGRMLYIAQCGTDGEVRREITADQFKEFSVVWESLDEKALSIAVRLEKNR